MPPSVIPVTEDSSPLLLAWPVQGRYEGCIRVTAVMKVAAFFVGSLRPQQMGPAVTRFLAAGTIRWRLKTHPHQLRAAGGLRFGPSYKFNCVAYAGMLGYCIASASMTGILEHPRLSFYGLLK